MRIALLTTHVPFVVGGAELLAKGLRDQLERAGHEAEIVSIPFNWFPSDRLSDSIVANSLLDIADFNNTKIDLAIGLKFPAYLARHPNKIFWLVHQHRQAYDMWDSGNSDLLHDPRGALLKGAIDQLDRSALSGRPVYTISGNVSKRLEHYNGIVSKPLYHPPPLADLLFTAPCDDFFLVPSRLGPSKRQDMVLEALGRTSSKCRAVFVGRPDDREYGKALTRKAEALGLSDRVCWKEKCSAEELAELYAKCTAVVFVPQDEDYGYVTLEAMLASKAVLTVKDAGGPLEFVRHGLEGLVADPTPDNLAESLELLWRDRQLATNLGVGARQRYANMEIGWDSVISTLTGIQSSPPSGLPSKAAAQLNSDAKQVLDPTDPNSVPEFLQVINSLPVKTIAELSECLDLGIGDAAPYFQTHWTRYLASLALLPAGRALRVLDLGSGPPYVFPALLHLLRPNCEFTIVLEAQDLADKASTIASRTHAPDLNVRTHSFNAEKDIFPFPDGSFDLVLAMEVLEHLALNPLHMLSEARRVLSASGSILITTPNIVSARSLAQVHAGDSPYSFGIFVPHHGVYGRHNREYTPHEVELLGKMAGFSTDLLQTLDVYGPEVDVLSLPIVRSSEFPVALRGRNIFYRGRCSTERTTEHWQALYVTDPIAIRGKISVQQEDGMTRIVLQNTGSQPWGAESLMLRAECYDPDIHIGKETYDIVLRQAVSADEQYTILLPGRQNGAAAKFIKLDLIQIGLGSLANLGIPRAEFVGSAEIGEHLARLVDAQ